jgi:CRP-like cAMP-binding protein
MLIEKAMLFQGLSPRFLGELQKHLAHESHAPGAFVFRRGGRPDSFFILDQGRVRLSYGEEGYVALVVSNPGDAFGWGGLVGRDAYTLSAECLTPAAVTRVPVREVLQLFDNDPADGLAFFHRLARLVADRLEILYKSIPAAHGERRASQGF